MNKGYMGIDLGTSSVKVIMRYENGEIQKSKAEYSEISPKGWCEAIASAARNLDTEGCVGVGLSSQVGTYIINDTDVISWNDKCGADEVKEIKSRFDRDFFVEEISMPHPDISSYPVPRLKVIQKKYGNNSKVCQPKDMIIRYLTGKYATDKYSWRGLANASTEKYSQSLLAETGTPDLPPILGYARCAGNVTSDASISTGIPEGTPVYTGLNDFYASIVGMGISSVGEAFDITGTSEHLGVISDSLCKDTLMVSSPYIQNYVHYGVTASSGASIKFALKNFGCADLVIDENLIVNSPVFLPYLNGERAPIFDPDATGMFFGINSRCTQKHMMYSVFEGVVMSLYHIYENLGVPPFKKLTVSGGAADIDLLNRLKAEIFDTPIATLHEPDTSALGAVMTAMIGSGAYKNPQDAAKDMCKPKEIILPSGNLGNIMKKRFEIYKEVYIQTKNTAGKLRNIYNEQ